MKKLCVSQSVSQSVCEILLLWAAYWAKKAVDMGWARQKYLWKYKVCLKISHLLIAFFCPHPPPSLPPCEVLKTPVFMSPPIPCVFVLCFSLLPMHLIEDFVGAFLYFISSFDGSITYWSILYREHFQWNISWNKGHFLKNKWQIRGI